MNKFIRVLMTGSLLWYLGEGMLGPLLAVFTEHIGGDILQISWAWATYLLVTGVMIIIVGKISDGRASKERLMMIGYVLNTILTFCYLLVSAPWQLFILQAGLGIAWAFATPTWSALYARHIDRKHDGSAYGFADGLPPIITACAILIGGLIINYFSFKTLFLLMGSIQLIATVYQAKILWMEKKKVYKKRR
ncbi:MAG: MFS transporter [Candidatus Nanoarchaeia archaeon]